MTPKELAQKRMADMQGMANAYHPAPEPTPPGVTTTLQLLANAQGETDMLLGELSSRLFPVLRPGMEEAQRYAVPPSSGSELATYIADRTSTQRRLNESLSDLLARIDL